METAGHGTTHLTYMNCNHECLNIYFAAKKEKKKAPKVAGDLHGSNPMVISLYVFCLLTALIAFG
jgi:general stress protein 26